MNKNFPSVVIGLGNPGEKYQNTRHNAGRSLVQLLQENKKLSWKKDDGYEWTESQPSFIRLNCFMNVSGAEVSRLLKYFRIDPSEIMVCYDDFDIPLGTIRIRKKGSSGSHNGLKSIVEHLQTGDFSRIRLGIGPLPPYQDPADFVLSSFSKEEQKIVQSMMDKAIQAIEMIVEKGIDQAMNAFNAAEK